MTKTVILILSLLIISTSSLFPKEPDPYWDVIITYSQRKWPWSVTTKYNRAGRIQAPTEEEAVEEILKLIADLKGEVIIVERKVFLSEYQEKSEADSIEEQLLLKQLNANKKNDTSTDKK